MKTRLMPALLLLLAGLSIAQSSGQAGPKFEVATIKLAASNVARNRVLYPSPERLSIPSMTLTWLIYTAYGEGLGTSFNVSGGPDWVNKTSYAIEAKAPQPATQRQLRVMLRSLLEERFALKIRQEARKGGSIYALVLDKADGKLGPNVEQWDGTCGGQPPANTDTDDPFTPHCPSGYRLQGAFLEGGTMYSVAEVLSLPQSRVLLGTIVQDQTGLQGRYKMHLDFQFNAPRPADSAELGFAGPSLFQAVRDQWGLKLEKAEGTLNVIVVESAVPPTEN